MDTASRQRVFKRVMLFAVLLPGLALVAVLACDQALFGWAPVPPLRDGHLIGSWIARDNQRSYTFRSDGTGEWFRVKWGPGTGGRPLRWGTFGAVLVTESFDVDWWARREYRYTVADDGKTLALTDDPGNKPHVLDRAAR